MPERKKQGQLVAQQQPHSGVTVHKGTMEAAYGCVDEQALKKTTCEHVNVYHACTLHPHKAHSRSHVPYLHTHIHTPLPHPHPHPLPHTPRCHTQLADLSPLLSAVCLPLIPLLILGRSQEKVSQNTKDAKQSEHSKYYCISQKS